MMLLLCGWGSGSAFVRILSFRLILTLAGLSPHFPSFLFRRAERSKQSTLSFILVLARGNTFLQYFSIFFTVFSFYPHIFFSLIKENIFKRKLKTFNFWWDAFCLLKNVMNFNFYPSTTSICLLSVGDIVVGDMILHCWPHYPLLFPLPAIHTFVFLLFLFAVFGLSLCSLGNDIQDEWSMISWICIVSSELHDQPNWDLPETVEMRLLTNRLSADCRWSRLQCFI